MSDEVDEVPLLLTEPPPVFFTEPCPACPHPWHGVDCQIYTHYDEAVLGYRTCGCASSLPR